MLAGMAGQLGSPTLLAALLFTCLQVRPGGAPDVPTSGNGVQVLKWLERNGCNFSRPVGGQPGPRCGGHWGWDRQAERAACGVSRRQGV